MLRLVKTKYGAVEGLPAADPRVTVFKGIPFAAPPVGENRWRAPQPPAPWDEVLKAYSFAPIGVQDTPGLGDNIYNGEWNVDPEIPMDEDCLYLNIWSPAMTANDKLPVLVWIFGGGFQWGNTQEMEFDAERLARNGIIVVSVNYRLASLGFLAHPEITKEAPGAPGNFGNLDQHAGIKWVYENIEGFGGDPERITVAGQSAGGASAMAQIASKKNEGMLKGAVIFSGMIRDPYNYDSIIVPPTLKEAEENGVRFFEFMGVSSLAEARSLDPYFIRAKYAEFVMTNPRMACIIDGQFLTDDPYKIYIEGKGLNVPVMSGNTSDEFFSAIVASSEEELKKRAEELYGDKAETFLNFPAVKNASGGRYGAMSVIEFSVKGAFMKRAHDPANAPGYYYCFDPDIPGKDRPGTFHSVDLWFFFNSISKASRPFSGRHFDLAKQMSGYFANFVKYGKPEGCDIDGHRLPEWQPYNAHAKNEMRFTSEGSYVYEDTNEMIDFCARNLLEKRQAFNPYMPSWEYVPDGEPHVFGDRVYVYGSHDFFDGAVFCMGDYICWSAPVDDLKAWKYEGVIYHRDDDPVNRDGHMCLYAPDVTKGPDGRYYIYYVLDKVGFVSVAVCDTPAGEYKFYGYVHYEDGTRLGDRAGDEPQFDPGVLTEGDKTYMYTGFCGFGDKSRHGSFVTVLGPDMLTIVEEPRLVVPGSCYSEGTTFEKHAFFEASSIRKRDDIYYFVYSSEVMHELCYATSTSPVEGFTYGGVIVSNADIGIDTYKPADFAAGYGSNNHGGFEIINGKYYIFYHRHTNGTWFSRQGCAEEIKFNPDGSIDQVEMTSCGLNGGPLNDTEGYPAHIVCNMFSDKNERYIASGQPMVSQGAGDGEKVPAFIKNISDGYTIGFKYFDCKGVTGMYIETVGYCNGYFEIRTEIGGEILGTISAENTDVWVKNFGDVNLPNGIHSIYFTWKNGSGPRIRSFGFVH